MAAVRTILFISFQILISTVMAAGQQKDPVISLGGGQLTLKPVGKAPAAVSSDAAGVRLRGGPLTLKEADAPDQPIPERHVVLEFERRLNQEDYPALEAKGVKIFGYVEGNSYMASIEHNRTAKLHEATKGINPCIRYGVIESKHKIAPSLAARSRTFSEGPQNDASEPIIVNVELWPDADFEAAKVGLGKIGHIENGNEYTKRLDIVLPSADAVQKLADSKYVQFIAPKRRGIIHNSHVRKSMSTKIVRRRSPGSFERMCAGDQRLGRSTGSKPLIALLWALKSGQFEDLEGAQYPSLNDGV